MEVCYLRQEADKSYSKDGEVAALLHRAGRQHIQQGDYQTQRGRSSDGRFQRNVDKTLYLKPHIHEINLTEQVGLKTSHRLIKTTAIYSRHSREMKALCYECECAVQCEAGLLRGTDPGRCAGAGWSRRAARLGTLKRRKPFISTL